MLPDDIKKQDKETMIVYTKKRLHKLYRYRQEKSSEEHQTKQENGVQPVTETYLAKRLLQLVEAPSYQVTEYCL